MNNKFFIAQLLMLLLTVSPLWAGEPTGSEDSERHSLVEHLTRKQMPRSINIDLHMRTALQAHFPQHSTGEDETAFRFDYIVLDIHGDLGKGLSYKYLQRLNKGSRVSPTDNLSQAIDYAWVRYDFGERFAVQGGRHALFFGGFEYEEYPVNVYDYAGIINNISCYLNGASFFYSPSANHTLGVQIMNNRQGSVEDAFGVLTEGLERPSMPLYYSLAWYSSYADSRFKMRYALTTGELLKDQWAFYVSGGAQYKTRKVDAYLDLAYQRSPIDHLGVIRHMATGDDGAVWDGVGRNVEYMTCTANLNYRFTRKWNLHLKGYYDRASVYRAQERFAEGNYISSWGYDASVEFYPLADENMHLYFNVGGKNYRECRLQQMSTPRDVLRFSLGFIYRLPVL